MPASNPSIEPPMGIFEQLESYAPGDSVSLAEVLSELPWNADGLLPAIAQQFDSGEVLMLAWMSRASLAETLDSGRVPPKAVAQG